MTSREFIVPIHDEHGNRGQLEIRFTEVSAGPFGATMRPEFSLAIFIGGGLFVTFSDLPSTSPAASESVAGDSASRSRSAGRSGRRPAGP